MLKKAVFVLFSLLLSFSVFAQTRIIERFDQDTVQDGVALGQLNGTTAITFRPIGVTAAKWIFEFDVAAQTGDVAWSYTPGGFTNATVPANNSVDITTKDPLRSDVISAGSITLTPATVSAAINWRATAYTD